MLTAETTVAGDHGREYAEFDHSGIDGVDGGGELALGVHALQHRIARAPRDGPVLVRAQRRVVKLEARACAMCNEHTDEPVRGSRFEARHACRAEEHSTVGVPRSATLTDEMPPSGGSTQKT